MEQVLLNVLEKKLTLLRVQHEDGWLEQWKVQASKEANDKALEKAKKQKQTAARKSVKEQAKIYFDIRLDRTKKSYITRIYNRCKAKEEQGGRSLSSVCPVFRSALLLCSGLYPDR